MCHAGRVIDLILHEARDYFAKTSDVDASIRRARHTLELLVLCAWSHYRLLENTRCLELEAGWDDEKIVFSVAGFVADGLGGLVPSLGAPANEVSGRLARYFGIVEETATMLALRHHKDIGFLQAYAVLAADAAAPRQTARVVELKKPEGYVPAPEFAAAGDDWLVAGATCPRNPWAVAKARRNFWAMSALMKQGGSWSKVARKMAPMAPWSSMQTRIGRLGGAGVEARGGRGPGR